MSSLVPGKRKLVTHKLASHPKALDIWILRGLRTQSVHSEAFGSVAMSVSAAEVEF